MVRRGQSTWPLGRGSQRITGFTARSSPPQWRLAWSYIRQALKYVNYFLLLNPQKMICHHAKLIVCIRNIGF
jgi:hypothetical protein